MTFFFGGDRYGSKNPKSQKFRITFEAKNWRRPKSVLAVSLKRLVEKFCLIKVWEIYFWNCKIVWHCWGLVFSLIVQHRRKKIHSPHAFFYLNLLFFRCFFLCVFFYVRSKKKRCAIHFFLKSTSIEIFTLNAFWQSWKILDIRVCSGHIREILLLRRKKRSVW